MADEQWHIMYAQRALPGNAVHGVLLVVNPAGAIVRTFEGLAVGPDGIEKAIGTSPDDGIKVFYDPEKLSLKYETAGEGFEWQDLHSSTDYEHDILPRIRAAEAAGAAINKKNIGYPTWGLNETNQSQGVSNSNAVINTLVKAMHIYEPDYNHWTPGREENLLNREEINAIRCANQLPQLDRGGSNSYRDDAIRAASFDKAQVPESYQKEIFASQRVDAPSAGIANFSPVFVPQQQGLPESLQYSFDPRIAFSNIPPAYPAQMGLQQIGDRDALARFGHWALGDDPYGALYPDWLAAQRQLPNDPNSLPGFPGGIPRLSMASNEDDPGSNWS